MQMNPRKIIDSLYSFPRASIGLALRVHARQSSVFGDVCVRVLEWVCVRECESKNACVSDGRSI
jgi:hypothetical protein